MILLKIPGNLLPKITPTKELILICIYDYNFFKKFKKQKVSNIINLIPKNGKSRKKKKTNMTLRFANTKRQNSSPKFLTTESF